MLFFFPRYFEASWSGQDMWRKSQLMNFVFHKIFYKKSLYDVYYSRKTPMSYILYTHLVKLFLSWILLIPQSRIACFFKLGHCSEIKIFLSRKCLIFWYNRLFTPIKKNTWTVTVEAVDFFPFFSKWAWWIGDCHRYYFNFFF